MSESRDQFIDMEQIMPNSLLNMVIIGINLHVTSWLVGTNVVLCIE